MKLAKSRLTAQGQVSVPVEVRRHLGLAPGAVLEWDVEGDAVIIRRAGRHTSEDIHRVLFPDGPPEPHALSEFKEGIRRHVRQRHARH